MSRITLNIAYYGSGIRSVAEQHIKNATEPTVVEMHFNGGTVQKMFTENCATDGSPELAREYLDYLVKTHDVYYDYSDDHSVWRRGFAEATRIAQVKEILTNRGISIS